MEGLAPRCPRYAPKVRIGTLADVQGLIAQATKKVTLPRCRAACAMPSRMPYTSLFFFHCFYSPQHFANASTADGGLAFDEAGPRQHTSMDQPCVCSGELQYYGIRRKYAGEHATN
jgi:hypothetical protein